MLLKICLYLIILIFVATKNGFAENLTIEKVEKVKDCNKVVVESKNPPTNWNSVRDWANSLPVLLKQDEERTKKLFEGNINQLTPVELIRDRFYQITSQPLQTVCTIGKQIGGEWLGNCGHFDGQKYVCLDNLYADIMSNKCLVYSFGIANDWSFEEVMAGLGCKVRAFDPTTSPASKPQNNNITFTALGLANRNGKMQITDNSRGNKKVLVNVATLKESIAKMKDSGKKISYLKVDIESSELDAIHEWISSGILEDVQQIGIEFHTGQIFLKDSLQISAKLSQLLEALKQLYNIGFRLISNTSNNCVGKSQDAGKQFYTFFDVVLYKP